MDAIKNGAELVEDFEIANVLEAGDRVVLSSSNGALLQASHAVFATGYEFLKAMEHPAHSIVSTWALASEPGIARPQWLDDYLVWEGSEPYLYFRTTPDGRIIVGGEDEDSSTSHSDTKKMESKVRIIRQKLKKLIGVDIGEPAFEWAAPFGTTTTGLPFIDLVPGQKCIYAVMGFGGNGITFSTIASQIITSRILGGADPDEDLFAFPG
jgi:glycine/D-amino acid oxidase-like deaminating enzyme